MAIDTSLVLAGIGAAGASGAELAWFAPIGTTAPTDATTALGTGWVSPGLVSEDGVTADLSNSSKDVKAYGLSAVVRKIVTDETSTFKVVFLESNTVSLGIYNRYPLTGDGSIVPDASGDFSTTEGQFRSQRYACAFDIVDGENRIRKYCPSVEVTEKDSFSVKAGEAIMYGLTLTAYANSAGVSVATFYHIPALAVAP